MIRFRTRCYPATIRPIQMLFYCSFQKKLNYKRCYEILQISEDSDQEEIRRAYIALVKKYHPDNPEGDLHKFQEIDKAFRILIDKKSKERWNVEEAQETQEFDIRHTAPQHRQYLSYGGVGSGTPFQRQKQYQTVRAMQASQNVLQHRISKVTAEENALMDKKVPFKHNIKTKYGLERLVEDLIQESMSKGEFNNLSGSGKPLKGHQTLNPYVDYVTHKINQVLIDNGFTPEWITLQKEIREEIEKIRDSLTRERLLFGPHPFCNADLNDWNEIVDNYKPLVDATNKKIDKFNLVVPILNKQMYLFNLEKEADNTKINGKCSSEGRVKFQNINANESGDAAAANSDTILSFIDKYFSKK